MTFSDDPDEPPETEPEDVPERLVPVEVPEPAVEDTPERGEESDPVDRASAI